MLQTTNQLESTRKQHMIPQLTGRKSIHKLDPISKNSRVAGFNHRGNGSWIVNPCPTLVIHVDKTWSNNNRPSPSHHHFCRWYKPFPNGWFITVLSCFTHISHNPMFDGEHEVKYQYCPLWEPAAASTFLSLYISFSLSIAISARLSLSLALSLSRALSLCIYIHIHIHIYILLYIYIYLFIYLWGCP